MPLNFKISGSGDPVIILHGFLGSLDNWQTFANRLSKDYMVITVDQRNHGRSPHTYDFSIPLMAYDLEKLMIDEWIHSATLIGHSMGGKTAMQFSTLFPEMVQRLIVVDIAPKTYEPRFLNILEALNQLPLKSLTSRSEADEILSERISQPAIRKFLLKNLKRNKNGFEWKINLSALNRGYESILQEINTENIYNGPTKFIRGEQSPYILDSDIEIIQAKFPSANITTIKDAGHWVHSDQPDQLLQEVNHFMKQG
ncbi:MAG: alpha/beta fold hydrolase [Bacteroidia bacterium]|nr:alpha/beta fold hydrolase [Bacteroidia bacterium]